MNPVSFKNNWQLRKIIANYEILEAIQTRDFEKLEGIYHENKQSLSSLQIKLEPHFQNIELAHFYLFNKASSLVEKVNKNQSIFQQIIDFVNLAFLPDSPINHGIHFLLKDLFY